MGNGENALELRKRRVANLKGPLSPCGTPRFSIQILEACLTYAGIIVHGI